MSQYGDVRAASARLGGLSSYGRTPDPNDKASAERILATARIDREIRDSLGKYGPLDPVQVTHLVGLLVASHHVQGEVFAAIESGVRAAVEAAQASTALDLEGLVRAAERLQDGGQG